MLLLNPYRFAAAAAPTDPHFSNVSLLLHGDGANNSTTFVDSSPSPKTVTAFGNAQISTAQSKFGGASLAFDGNGDYLALGDVSSQLVLGGDFTIELFVWFNSLSGFQSICQSIWNSGGFFLFHHLDHPNKVSFYVNNFSSGVPILVQSSSMATNTFYHVAVTRAGNTFKLFINGVLESSATSTLATITRPVEFVGIYSDGFSSVSFGLNGYLDEIRITKGVARYVANFTPPTAPFPDA